MQLYETLANNQKHKYFFKGEEYRFFLDYRHILDSVPAFKYLSTGEDDFHVIRANIVIRSLLNKVEIEEALQFACNKSIKEYGVLNHQFISNFVKERMSNMPYIQEGDSKIYVPIFTRALNLVYSNDFEKLQKAPYDALLKSFDTSVIDPFETYNFELYNSFFTKFLVIKQSATEMAVYHFDYQTIYFINNQGRLDAKIALFDKYLKRINTNHILDRIAPAVDAYFENNREKLYDELINNNLISAKLIHIIKHDEIMFERKMDKKIK